MPSSANRTSSPGRSVDCGPGAVPRLWVGTARSGGWYRMGRMLAVALLVPVAWLLGTFPSAPARRPGPRPRHPEGGFRQSRRVERRPAARLEGGRPRPAVRLREGCGGGGRGPGDRRAGRALRARRRGRRRATRSPLPQGREGRRRPRAGALLVLYPFIVLGLAVRVVRGRPAVCTRRRSRRCWPRFLFPDRGTRPRL